MRISYFMAVRRADSDGKLIIFIAYCLFHRLFDDAKRIAMIKAHARRIECVGEPPRSWHVEAHTMPAITCSWKAISGCYDFYLEIAAFESSDGEHAVFLLLHILSVCVSIYFSYKDDRAMFQNKFVSSLIAPYWNCVAAWFEQSASRYP